MKSNLFGSTLEKETNDKLSLQNERMLRVRLDGEIMAKQGSMVAYQGEVDFAFQGGGIGRMLKKAFTGEGTPLMKCTGKADLFLAQDADEVHVIYLEDESLIVNGANILAFDSSLAWDIKRVEGVSVFAGGIFNTTLTGTGFVAITSHGSPVTLDAGTSRTYVDVQSAVAWSASLRTSVKSSFKAGSLIGRGSGELFQLEFTGQGFVVVQASEGVTVPPHSHG